MCISKLTASIRLPIIAAGGPLPWLPGIPQRIAADPMRGPYLNAQSQRIAQLAERVRLNVAADGPAWAPSNVPVPAELIADVQVWRAATQVDPGDLRPTGTAQLGGAARIFQQQLEIRLADTNTNWRWRNWLATEVPSVTSDPYLPELAERLNNLIRAGCHATQLVRSAASTGPLPDDHPAVALWWRILDQVKPQAPTDYRATSTAVPTASITTRRSRHKQPPSPRSTPPQAFGPGR
jgi:hypothetical protein